MFWSEFLLVTIAEWAMGSMFCFVFCFVFFFSVQLTWVSVWLVFQEQNTCSLYDIGSFFLGQRFEWSLGEIVTNPPPTSQTCKMSARLEPWSSGEEPARVLAMGEAAHACGLGSVLCFCGTPDGAARALKCCKWSTAVHLRTKGENEVNKSRNSQQP